MLRREIHFSTTTADCMYTVHIIITVIRYIMADPCTGTKIRRKKIITISAPTTKFKINVNG
jgi:hypothetical protein